MEHQTNTISEYKEVITKCQTLFQQKTQDYGTSWRILRLPSLTDQIFIKAMRIRSIQEKGTQKVIDDISSEFIGIINYCIIALIQIALESDKRMEIPVEETMQHYQEAVEATLALQINKNHDYGEAWRSMRVMRLLRVKQIEDNGGKTIISEGIIANYQDMLNYAVFCLIKMKPTENQ
jgi:Nucleotide modification associated domain 1